MDEKYYIILLSLHGLVRGKEPEYGRDSDTGGQIKYLLELATALGERKEVDRVDIITRQVIESRVSPDYAEPTEEITDKVKIIRLPFGPRRYLRKERLWSWLEVCSDNLFKYLRRGGRIPDIIHAHYADAGYVGTNICPLLEIPMIFTGHSLGRVKKETLIKGGMRLPEIEQKFHIGRRIEAEEKALEHSAIVIASSRQELEEQYRLYDNYQTKRMVVIPPGVDLSRFSPPGRIRSNEGEKIRGEIDRFLEHPKRPLVTAIARPDKKKNLITLIKAYGENQNLRETANLLIVAGNREDIQTLGREAKEVMTEILISIDRYDLHGKVALPKKHSSEDIPEIYKIAARRKGVFVNPALNEPFGLTLLEAAASSLPIVATNDGGPKEIIANCKNGVLIDPTDHKKMGEEIYDLISDKRRWQTCSRKGVLGAGRYYSWPKHAQKYIRTIRKVVSHGRRKLSPTLKKRLITHDRLLVCDIDNTLVGEKESLSRLIEMIIKAGSRVGFGVATGRNLKLTLAVLREWNIPVPNLVITSVGTSIYYGANLTEDMGYKSHIDHRWQPDKIGEILSQVDGLKLQPKDGQDSHKISFYIDPKKAPSLKEIKRILRKQATPANVVYSHGMYLDILPLRASKGQALRFIAGRWGIPISNCLVAGDSGNDEEMLTGITKAVVVGNHSPELNSLQKRPGIYFAEAEYAGGILEGIEHYNFFADLSD